MPYEQEIASTFQLLEVIISPIIFTRITPITMLASTFMLYLLALAGAFLLPGPDMAIVLATGAARGARTAMVTALGIATARGMHVLLSGLGLAALMAAHPQSLLLVKWAGAAYLCYMAYRLLRAGASSSPVVEEAVPPSAGNNYLRGLLTNLLNPKALLFCSMLMPQFVSATSSVPVVMQTLWLGLALVLVGLLFDIVYAVLAARLARRIRAKPTRAGKFVLPAVFVLLAGRLVAG